MISNFKNLLGLTSQLVKNSEIHSNFINEKLIRTVVCNVCSARQKLNFHTDVPRMKRSDQNEVRKAVQETTKKDEGIAGATSSEVDISLNSEIFPTHDLPNKLYDGIPFKDLPIVYINCSKNNTILGLANKGITQITRSCGQEGFKNSRKGTNIAGQTAGISFALRVVKKGYKTVRVVLKGLGPGRLSAMKGLELGGLTMISVTDATVDSRDTRPRKQRKL